MFELEVDYLCHRGLPDDPPWPDPDQEAVAAVDVCLRWGSYPAVLASRGLSLWSAARNAGVCHLADPEMARINIQISAELEQRIGLMRDDPGLYPRLAWAARLVRRARVVLQSIAKPAVAAKRGLQIQNLM